MSNDYYRAFSGAKWIVFVNILQKLVNFGLTQLLLLSTSPDVHGKASIQLELFLSTILFLSREGIKLSLLREDISDPSSLQELINLSWLPSIFLSIATISLVSFSTEKSVYTMYCIGALLESFGEPYVNLNLNRANLKPKLLAETLGVFVKSASILIFTGYLDMGVFGYSCAQILYGLVYLITLILQSKDGVLLPKLVNKTKWVETKTVILAGILTIPAFLKHILTESDKISLSILSNNYDQGIFAVASNYGSLAARMLFLPLEDTSRIAFSKFASSCTSMKDLTETEQLVEKTKTGLEMRKLLLRLLRIVIFISSVFVIFGVPYVKLLVNIAFAVKWRSDRMVRVLQWYCIYLMTLGINGVTEAFVHSVTSSDDFSRVNISLIASSIVFVITLFFTMKQLGSSAVVAANTLAMTTRILGNAIYIDKYFEKKIGRVPSILYDASPTIGSIVMSIICAVTTQFSSIWFYSTDPTLSRSIMFISIGGILGVSFCVGSLLLLRREDKALAFEFLYKYVGTSKAKLS